MPHPRHRIAPHHRRFAVVIVAALAGLTYLFWSRSRRTDTVRATNSRSAFDMTKWQPLIDLLHEWCMTDEDTPVRTPVNKSAARKSAVRKRKTVSMKKKSSSEE